MRVIQPWVTRFTEVEDALDQSGFTWESEHLDSDDDESYYRLVAALWIAGEDFCIVEQDNVPASGVLAEIERCPCEWGAEPYWLHGAWGARFGVVRFRSDLIRRHPHLLESVQQRSWSGLDSAVMNHLRLAGPQEPHWHWPAAKHLRSDWSPLFSCNACGTALAEDDLRRDPLVECRSCHAINVMPVPRLTMTDSVL
jgi:hypothetical protein